MDLFQDDVPVVARDTQLGPPLRHYPTCQRRFGLSRQSRGFLIFTRLEALAVTFQFPKCLKQRRTIFTSPYL